MTRATRTLVKPMPRIPIPIEMTARLGRARPMLEALMAKDDPRCRWPSQTPSGIAIAMATAMEASETHRWASVFSRNRLRLLKKKVNAWPKTDTSRSSQPPPAPGRDCALDHDQNEVGDQGEQDREDAGADELGLEAGLDGVEDRLAQAPGADERSHGGETDRGHGRDPQTRDDRRQGKG